MKAALALLMVLLPGAAAARSVQEPPLAISYEEIGPWGTFRLAWRVEASGAGVYEQAGPALDQREQGVVRMDLAEFARLGDLVRPLDGAAQIPCPDAITDQGVRVLSWTRGEETTTYILDRGCESDDARAIAERMDRAKAIVRAWTAGRQP